MPQDKPGFFNKFLNTIGIAKEEPAPAPRPAAAPARPAPAPGMQRARTNDPAGTNGLAGPKPATQPLTSEEKAKQSEERRYLISAYESTPTLIPEFQNPQYMYKMISNERDHTQEVLNELLEERKSTLYEYPGELPAEIEARLAELDARAQELRNDLTRFFLLIKRVAGITKSGTGGTDFLDPLKGR